MAKRGRAGYGTVMSDFEIFLSVAPGLEPALAEEAAEAGFRDVAVVVGGVTVSGGWPEVWRANLVLRGASRVLARIGAFRVMHIAQLDKRARKFPWGDVLRPDVPCRVEVTTRASKVYHAGAAKQRIERALTESFGARLADDAAVILKVRIEDDLCTISVDTSGESLHKRGHKQGVGKAPMRETLAAMFLRQCGYHGTEPVYDPMCGSGTFVIEAAEIAAGLLPGRSRRFAFEELTTFDSAAFAALKDDGTVVTWGYNTNGNIKLIPETNPAINPVIFCLLSPTLNDPLNPEPPNQEIIGAKIPEILTETDVSPNEAIPVKTTSTKYTI